MSPAPSTLRVGLLVADHVQPRFASIAGDYPDMFVEMVAAADPHAEVVPYDATAGELPPSPDACDAWMCTGSSASVYDPEPWIAGLGDFVREVHRAGTPFVGVCFGHQLLAHALGGRTERAAAWGVGALPMEPTDPTLPSPATLLYSHQDQVTRLPDGGRVLARAPHCPVAMLAVGDTMVGLQAHPEFGAPYVRALLEHRVDRIGEAETAAALASLDHPTDERPIAAWLLAFLRGAHP